MQHNIEKGPSYAVLRTTMDRGDRLMAETGAMISRSESVHADAEVGGGEGIGGIIKSAVSSSRDLVENAFEAREDGAELTLAPDHPGDVFGVDVGRDGPIKVNSGSTLAWEPTVERSTGFNDARSFFSAGSLRVLELSGTGRCFLSAYGSIVETDAEPDDPTVVDTDHLIAWTDGLDVSMEKDGSIKSAVLGGEGLVSKFSGEGRVWIQTRNPAVFQRAAGGEQRDDDDSGVDPGDFL
ncbi:TIGR00266 family protein [Halorubrum sp. AD140]|uniref:TIGR00266 family protein n=1 Tax=Halorubrum sp. AD140 TaxID=3050073 RepID=UPI002ACC908B|nr:TIGR00266 family protein [Halorubrum sp. AD140]MDZ5812273.1 TIGR00266 family protein [Halorubrum sp. AD140]